MTHKLLAQGIANVNGIATLEGFEGVFGGLLRTALGLSGILVFIMLVVGGFQYMTAGGDPKSLESARRTLTYAIAGVILVALAYFLLVFVGAFTGQNAILNFEVRL